jgi:phosphoglycerate dehydrogenase-like enzyme
VSAPSGSRIFVLVAGAPAADPPPGLSAAAEVVDLGFAETAESVAEAIGRADVVLTWSSQRELFEGAWDRARRLRWMQTASAGVDALLFPALVEGDVVLTNARGVFDSAIAEWAIGMMVAFAKDLVGALDAQRRREWRRHLTEPLAGRRLLVVGAGSIGRAVARGALPLGMQVRGLGRRTRPGDATFGVVLGADELPDGLAWADYVVNALPGTPSTRHAFDEEAFAAMRPGARFINVGRGSTVDEPALVRALADGRIAGAALDVFEEEPLPADSPLWDMPNVIVFPHVSGNVAGWRESVVELFLENLMRFVRGEGLRNVVDKRLGYPAGS